MGRPRWRSFGTSLCRCLCLCLCLAGPATSVASNRATATASGTLEASGPSVARSSAARRAGTQCGTQVGGQPARGAWRHVALVVFENKTLPQIVGDTTHAPFLTGLAKACANATNMHHLTTTSLTNYIALTSGYTGHDNGREVLITSTKLPRIWPQDSVSIFEAMGSQAREWAAGIIRFPVKGWRKL